MKEDKDLAPLIHEMIITVISVSGVYYSETFNIVAMLVLIVNSIYGCINSLKNEQDKPLILIITNSLMIMISVFMLFQTIGVYNGQNQLLLGIRKLSLCCVAKIGVDVAYTIWYNYIKKK